MPPVAINFYSFRLMVTLGLLFGLTFVVYLFFALRDTLAGKRWLLRFGVLSLFLGYIASEAGWVVAEVGRQPWAIQGLLPVGVASTGLAPASVQTTFFVFLDPLHHPAGGRSAHHAETDHHRTGGEIR